MTLSDLRPHTGKTMGGEVVSTDGVSPRTAYPGVGDVATLLANLHHPPMWIRLETALNSRNIIEEALS